MAEPVERPFNRLTSLVVSDDLRSIRLFGIYDPDGPKQEIPYGKLFADAFALPKEGVTSGVRVPGFSLELAPKFATQRPAIKKKLEDANTDLYAFIGRNHQIHELYVTSALAQARKEAVEGIRAVFKIHGFPPQKIDEILSTVKTADDLYALLIGIQRAGLVRADDADLNMALKLAVERFRQAKGNIFFYPEQLTADYVGTPIQIEPRFYGINPNSQLARISLEGDIALKSVIARDNLKAVLPFHQTRLEWAFRNLRPEESRVAESSVAANLRPKTIALSSSPDGHVIFFDHEDVTIFYGPDDANILPSAEQRQYSEFLSSHFNDYAEKIVPLWMVRELYKIIAAARYLKAKGVTLSAAVDNTWKPPRNVNVVWQAAALGTGGGTIERVVMVGGVHLSVIDATSVAALSSQRIESLKAATAQLDSVYKSGANAGACYDGQAGCQPGVPLGFVKIGGGPRGAASISSDVLTQMKSRPELKKLLDDEQNAKAAWDKTQNELREKEASLAAAKTPEDRGRLQVELSKTLQKASNEKSVLDTTQVKVEQGAKLIVSHK